MSRPNPDGAPPLAALASTCLAQVPESPTTFHRDAAAFATAFADLLRGVAASDARCAFDRDGRPGAIAAVRRALPASERELFDVILEDVACELAAHQEALYRMVIAATRAD